MQILRSGMSVLARRRRWRVVDVRAYDDCQLITLSSLVPRDAGHEARLLVPFDSIEPVRLSRRLRVTTVRHWRRACRALLANGFADHQLRAAGRARMELLPHQLEPAIALICGQACRLLLADDVGLGKTIQAGLAIAELRARGAADRVLVVTPAGLREQWVEELSRRFDIPAEIVDFRAVAQRTSAIPYGVNPWTTWPIAVTSIDYVKRAEVLPAVAACSWDAVIVDEAHGLAGDSDRHEAIAALATRAAYVILLTATPHNGDARAFGSLCAIGGQNDRLLIFRRTRAMMPSAAPRRVHRLLLRPSVGEQRMHARLAEFGAAVRAERGDNERQMWLALTVLHKRAYSSAYALWQSVARRLAAMDSGSGDDEDEQLALPFDANGEYDSGDEAPRWNPAITLRDRAAERNLLTALAAAAQAATGWETKLKALRRLLARIAEPVIVFTEYRDTLAHVARYLDRPAAVLHGGLSRRERATALRAFAEGEHAVLLATDAAGEGLNLQAACRTVVNLELPWNPMRLEQRIGRVDRIGQRRIVHAFHLIASGTGEQRLLANLRDRIARAKADIGAANPLGRDEADLARIAILDVGATPARDAPSADWPGTNRLASCEAEAGIEARRLAAERAARAVTSPSTPGPSPNRPSLDGPLITRARNAHTRRRLGARVLMIWEWCAEDGCGRCITSRTMATTVRLKQPLPVPLNDYWVDRLIGVCAREALPSFEASAAPFVEDATSAAASFLATRIARERAIAETLTMTAFQPGLFDRRAHHAQAAARASQQETAGAASRRIALLERSAKLSILRPALRLVLLP